MTTTDTEATRVERGFAMANAYRMAGGKIAAITFKAEIHRPLSGPVYAYAEGVKRPILKPVGDPDPEGVFYLGWQTKKWATALAKGEGLTLEVY